MFRLITVVLLISLGISQAVKIGTWLGSEDDWDPEKSDTVVSNAAMVAGRYVGTNGAARFSGMGDSFVSVLNDKLQASSNGSFTMMSHVYFDGRGQGMMFHYEDPERRGTYLMMQNYGGAAGITFQTGICSAERTPQETAANSACYAIQTQPFGDPVIQGGAWHFVGVRYDPNNAFLDLLVDGKMVNSTSTADSAVTHTTAGDLILGRYFRGTLFCVQLYNNTVYDEEELNNAAFACGGSAATEVK